MTNVRVRFAPSPTGSLHVGNARTAVVNWLYARQQQGTLILRIEDTDLERSSSRSEETILEDLRWLGLDWDEGPDRGGSSGPYRQSERSAEGLYRKAVERLHAAGRAYPCFCSAEDLEAERERRLQGCDGTFKYSGKCRGLQADEARRRMEWGESHVWRFRTDGQAIRVRDLVLGEVSFEGDVLDDFILLRSNGLPSYNFAVVVDDAAMAVTHVVRGNDHLSNTPKQVALYEALGETLPEFAHIPMILGDDGARLSKRDGATSVGEFRDMGILPNALVNFLSLLSWSSPSGDEILDRDRLVGEFDFSRVSKSAARFDREKLKWMNGQYIRNLAPAELGERLRPWLPDADNQLREQIAGVIQPRLEYLTDAPKQAAVFLEERPVLDAAVLEHLADPDAVKVLELFRETFRNAGEYSDESMKSIVKQVQTTAGVKGPGLWKPLRYALTGEEHGPELLQVVPVLGFAKCAALCESALEQVRSLPAGNDL